MDYPASIIKAIHEVMQKVGYVQKKSQNAFHKYRYANEAALLEALRPAMLEAGLILIPSGKTLIPIDEYGNTHITMEYTLAHTSGDVWPDKVCSFGCGNDKSGKKKDDTFAVGDKGVYQATTGAMKYLLFKLFLIETGDDPENDGGKKTTKEKTPAPKADSPPSNLISEPQRKRLFALSKEHKWEDTGVKSLLALHGFDSSKDITKDKYKVICDALELGMTGIDPVTGEEIPPE